MSGTLISIIGPPASGKTTLAQWLAGALPGRLILEDYAGNPFLAEAYLGRGDLALPAQLYFLFSRVAQLNPAAWRDTGFVVSDYGYCQDAVYAGRNLSAGVCLDGAEDVLLERIARRGRQYETAFSAGFLSDLRQAYREVAAEAACPVIAVDSGAVNLMNEPAREELMQRILAAVGKCREGKGIVP